MAIPQLGAFPSPPLLGQTQSVFNTNASNTLSYMSTWVTEMNAVSSAIDSATTAINASETNIETLADNVTAAVNNKGAWSALTGALNIPATVNHADRTWSLNTNLADVALSEPTLINSDWTNISIGQSDLDLKADQSTTYTRTETDNALALKALLGGANTQKFKVANATLGDEAVSKSQMETAITASAGDTRLNTADEDYAGQAAGVEIRNSNAGEWIKNQCTAWVNFNGTNGAIRDSFNVASVVRNSTGNYTVTFNVAMDNANYAVGVMGDSTGSRGKAYMKNQGTPTTTSITFQAEDDQGTPSDATVAGVLIFGGKV